MRLREQDVRIHRQPQLPQLTGLDVKCFDLLVGLHHHVVERGERGSVDEIAQQHATSMQQCRDDPVGLRGAEIDGFHCLH